MASEDFTQSVAEKLSELTGEKPTVSEQEIADALLADSGGGSIDSARLRDALDELQVVSVAVLLGENSESGRMWRHSGMTDADARRLLAEQAELERRDAEAQEQDFEAAALARAAEIEGGEDVDEEPEDDPAAAAMRRRDRSAPSSHRNSGETQRVELPMAVAGALDEEAVGKLVTAGLRAADEAGAGFEFIVTR